MASGCLPSSEKTPRASPHLRLATSRSTEVSICRRSVSRYPRSDLHLQRQDCSDAMNRAIIACEGDQIPASWVRLDYPQDSQYSRADVSRSVGN